MRKLIHPLDGGAGNRAGTGGLFGSKVAGLLRHGPVAGLVPETIITALGLVLIGLLGWINLQTVRGLNFEFLLPARMRFGRLAARGREAQSCARWYRGFVCTSPSTASGDASRAGWWFYCNSLIRLLAFAAIGWLAAQVGRLTRGPEPTVEQRTSRLQSEVEEHEETVELLRETVQLFRQVTENITDVFWVTPPSKEQVDYVSPAFEQVWGESCQTLYDSPATWLEGIHPEDRERVTRAALAKQITGEYDEEYRVVRPDGSLRWVHDRAFPVKNEAGAVYRLVGIAEDITERKRNEHLLEAQRNMGVALSSTSDLRFALNRLLEVAVQLGGH